MQRNATPVADKLCWVGAGDNYITLGYTRLKHKRVALRADYHLPVDGLFGEFDYIVVTDAEARQTLRWLLEEVGQHLQDRGHSIDNANNLPALFAEKLHYDLLGQLH